MALLSRIKSPDWQDGDTLTAADLDAEFNNVVNGLNGASDISVLSVTTSGNASIGGSVSVTGNSNVTGNASFGGTVSGLPSLDYVSNLGLTLSGGLLTIKSANTSTLSNSNPGRVTMEGTTAGQMVDIRITAPITLQDDANATSYFTNLEWGVSAGANWAQDVPFFLYVANKSDANVTGVDGASAIFIARNPSIKVTPTSSNNIGNSASLPSTDDQTAIVLAGAYTKANYTSLPAQLIGAVRMRYATATHDWTIQTLGNNDGFGSEQLHKTFATAWNFPTAQNGAASGTNMLDNGGTAPTWTNSRYWYHVNRDGSIRLQIAFSGDGSGDGAGAVQAEVALPTLCTMSDGGGSIDYLGSAMGATTISGGCIAIFEVTHGSAVAPLFYQSAATVTSNITNAMFSNGNRTLYASFTYQGY